MDNYEISDDFERFCQIAQRSPRDSLAPIIQITEPTYHENNNNNNNNLLKNQSDYSTTLNVESLKRASSFREPKRRTSFQPSSFSGEISATRSPIRFSPQWDNPNELNQSIHSSSSRYKQQHPRYFNEISETNVLHANDTQRYWQNQDISRESQSPYSNSPIMHRSSTTRDRPGSMKETSYKRSGSQEKHRSRPSAPTLHPANQPLCQYSPSRHSVAQTDEHMLRVRRFERNKHGDVISKGDRDIPQIEIFASRSPSGDSRGSVMYSRSVLESSQHLSESSLSDEVIEIPAVTTNLANSPRASNDGLHRTYGKRASSPVRGFVPETRLRSKSWAIVTDSPETSPNKLESPPGSESFLDDRLLQVQVIGAARVGKTSMCMQFHTSESIEDPNDSVHDDEQLNPVRVEINNLKASLVFMETDINVEDVDDELNSVIVDTVDAYLVIYAVDDRSSFYAARKIIGLLLSQCKRSSAIILAANKCDLVRTRVVTTEDGKNLAQIYSCSFYEISTSINHRVDDLLVGILIAIKEQQKTVQRERERLDRMVTQRKSMHTSPKHKNSITALKTPANTVVKFFRKHFSTRKNEQSLV
ncbi:GTP-binding protein [Schistosoma japonicum]|uniref:GTP-binding protein n=1 Tax=Schistosoma japonicum TaxID=6182 RepID=A0A4Z2CXD6_SCHJA|nr:GTP-binding protein [Schistosoma japonicum]